MLVDGLCFLVHPEESSDVGQNSFTRRNQCIRHVKRERKREGERCSSREDERAPGRSLHLRSRDARSIYSVVYGTLKGQDLSRDLSRNIHYSFVHSFVHLFSVRVRTRWSSCRVFRSPAQGKINRQWREPREGEQERI